MPGTIGLVGAAVGATVGRGEGGAVTTPGPLEQLTESAER